jgi:hypothetical protein
MIARRRGQTGKSTPTVVITEFPISANSRPQGITTGPDGNLWFADGNGNSIVKLTISQRYSICLLYDSTKAVHSGSTLPVKLALMPRLGLLAATSST